MIRRILRALSARRGPVRPTAAEPIRIPLSDDQRARVARRHLTEAVRHATAALADVQRYCDTKSTDEAHVREMAAHHQMTDAMHALGRARAALPSPPRSVDQDAD